MDVKDILRIYTFQKNNLYLCTSNLNVDNYKFNSTLLFSDLTILVNGNMYIQGEPGGGKTTGSGSAINLFSGIPPNVMEVAKVVGNDDQTEEKLIARPDIGKLNNGEEKNVWSYLVQVGPKILDEFNRFHPRVQNILFTGIDTGNWSYLNEIIDSTYNNKQVRMPIFATANYPDEGNHNISPPMSDRFDISVDSPTIGLNDRRALRWSNPPSLDDKIISEKMHQVLRDKSASYEKVQEELISLSNQYKESLGKRLGIKLPSYDDLEKITSQIKKLPFTKEAELFMDLVVNELNYCTQKGQVRSNEKCISNCSNKDYLCGKKSNGFSQRGSKSWEKYSKALAWVTGSSAASLEHVSAVLPYVIAHRLLFTKDYVTPMTNDKTDIPIYIHVAQKSVQDLKKRFSQIKSVQKKFVRYMAHKELDSAIELAKQQEHPVFEEYIKTYV